MKPYLLEQPKKEMTIYLLGDTHYPRGKRSKFVEVLEKIRKEKEAYMIGMGDWVEGIIASDPRYDPEEIAKMILKYKSLDNLIDEQWYKFESDITPLAEAGKIIGLHSGNHNSNFVRRYSYNELRRICKRLDIPYLGDGFALIQITYGGEKGALLQTYHGNGGGVTSGYAIRKLENYSRIVDDVDLVASGHTHKLFVNISIAPLKLENGKLKQKLVYQCSTGSFLGNYEVDYTSYAERKAYLPLPIGYVKVKLVKGKIVSAEAVPV